MVEDKVKGYLVGGLQAIFRLRRKEVAMIKRWVLIPIVIFITLVGLKGIVIAAGDYETAVNEGNVFVRKQMYQEALNAYERAIQLKQDASEVWDNKAVVLDYLGKYGEAVNSFEKAIQYKPDYFYGLIKCFNCLFILGLLVQSPPLHRPGCVIIGFILDGFFK